jgi:molybdopterin biosynthesis enzyme
MISVDEALERILGYVSVLEPEEKPILQALGQVLAEDVVSPFNIPPLDNTAMDGYAVQAASTAGASRRRQWNWRSWANWRPAIFSRGRWGRARRCAS